MSDPIVDLRSDTLTQPTVEMRAAMAAAKVGDDVFDEDPTVHQLQDRIAELLGKEAAIYVPSGTMSNQLAIRLHCRPGDEFLCEDGCHINRMEQNAHVQLSGVSAQGICGDFGVLEVRQLQDKIRPADDHCVRTRAVCLENTHNRGGGRIFPYESIEPICRWAHEEGLTTHLDGARLFNAVVETGIPAQRWAESFDTVSVCFSKGLGAPVGSALVGSADRIRQARRHRKAFGGGMRQAGMIAAGALFALDHHIDRLADDHHLARQLADAISAAPGLRLTPPEVQTNIVIFTVDPEQGTAPAVVDRLEAHGVRMLAISPHQVRAVTHLNVNPDGVQRAIDVLEQITSDRTDRSKIPAR